MEVKTIAKVEYRYSAEEQGMETIARGILCDNGVCCVLQLTRDEYGQFYYGVFCDYCKPETLESRESFLRFILGNETNGYSCGSFDTLEEVNEQMKADGVWGYGYFDSF